MYSIKAKITLMTVSVIVVAMVIAAVFGVTAIRNVGNANSNQSLLLLCEVGEKNLDSYFESVEKSVEMVSAYVQSDLNGIEEGQLQEHLDRVSDMFKKLTYNTNGVLTYYYRIDPEVSSDAKGFWFVNMGDDGFKEHEVTDITQYDTHDTSSLVWFTVPKATGQSVWLPPYVTENLDERVISYNKPVYYNGKFIGVIGIEIDYSTMAEQVDNITLYDSGYAFINDAEGDIVYHPKMDVTEYADGNQPKVPDGLLGESGFVTYTYDGVEKQAVWLPLSNGMRLNVSVPVSEINAEWQKWVVNVIVVFGVLLVVFIILITRFVGRITRPLQDLTEAAKQVNANNYDFKLSYSGNDEIGVLTQSFAQLTSHLKTYISDLNDLAYADALTSVHNKGAFDIYLRDLQMRMKDPEESCECAVCVFDCNNLKAINDEYGHAHGDIYLKTACKLICEVYDHSPVFRIGGDEFVVVLTKSDFKNRDKLIQHFDERSAEINANTDVDWEKVNIAWGMAAYDPQDDSSLDETVRRADKRMYEHKWLMKLV